MQRRGQACAEADRRKGGNGFVIASNMETPWCSAKMRLTFKTETTRANATTVRDLYTIPGSKRWRRNVVVSSPQRVDFTAANSTTSVVILNAARRGARAAADEHQERREKLCTIRFLLNADGSKARRARVHRLKNAAFSFSKKFKSRYVLLYSRINSITVPKTRSVKDARRQTCA